MTVETIERELTDLVAIPSQNALTVFSTERKGGEDHPIDTILAKVRSVIDGFTPDLTTAKGRKEIASMAHRVAKAKTALEDVGKKLADEQKSIPKRIDATRKHVKDTLDAWRDEVRKPLTDWETAEELRVTTIKATLNEWTAYAADQTERPSDAVRDRLDEMNSEAVTAERFAEYADAAAELKAAAIASLTDHLARAEKREADAAELEKLRQDAAERAAKEDAERAALAAKEREAQIAKEAEDRARAQAEADAKAKIEAAERALREQQEASDRALKAQQEAAEKALRGQQEAAAEAARKAQQAIDDERREREAKAEKEAAEKAAREANLEHRKKINTAALEAFKANGIDEATAIEVIKLIARSQIPAITITY